MKTRIKSIKQDKNKYLVELEKNIFRSAGGGQPADKGTIKGKNFELNVIDIKTNGILVTEKISGKVSKTEVEAKINLERKEKLTRMHSGEHILFKSLQNIEPSLKLDKIRLNEKESTIIVYAKSLDWENLFKAENLANKIISENKEIKEHLVNKKEINKFPDLRLKIDRIKDEKIRVIEIKDFDFSACSGTHCKNTNEIKKILITSLKSSGNNKYEIKFKIDINEDLYEMSRIVRLISSLLGCEQNKIISTIKNLKEEQIKLKDIARKKELKFQQEKINNINLYHLKTEDYDQNILIKQGNKITDKENSFVCMFNNTKKGLQIILISSAKTSAKDILSKLGQHYSVKGGGKDNFAMGMIINEDYETILDHLKKILKNEN